MKKFRKASFLALLLLGSLLSIGESNAQKLLPDSQPSASPSPSPSEAPPTDYSALLKEVINAGPDSFEKNDGATADEYREYVNLLSQIIETQALIEEHASRVQRMASQIAEISNALQKPIVQDITPETSLLRFDTTRLDLWQAQTWLAALNKINANRANQERDSFDNLKKEQNILQNLQNANPQTPHDRWLLKLQETRVAAALIHHRVRADSLPWKSDIELQKKRIKFAELILESLAGKVTFPQSVLDKQRSEIEVREQSFTKRSMQTEIQIRKFSQSSPVKNNPPLSALLLEGLENQIQLIEYKRVAMMMKMQIWQLRYDIWNTADSEALEKAGSSVNARIQDTQTWQPLITGFRTKLQERKRQAMTLLGASKDDQTTTIRDFVEKSFQQEESSLEKWETDFDSLLELLTLVQADLADRQKTISLGRNFDTATSTVLSQFTTIWNTELFQLTDSVYVNGQLIQRPSSITLGMLLSALLILIIGGVLSAVFSRWLRKHLTERFHLDANTGAIVQKFSHYILLIAICLMALAVVKIPLTIFALLGGAAAIAVGFGTQQLVSNLISGIILLFERPMRIGDQVDVGAFTGTVTAIGTRCSQLRRADGVEILIPNSIILQSTLVNYTLTDAHARQELLVGINYGSPVEHATSIILKIATTHPHVLKTPPPEVFFHDFGNDAIVLRLLYWIDRSIPGLTNRAPSELRFAIYNAFARAEIGLAFPQRDVHIDTTKPFPVTLISPLNK